MSNNSFEPTLMTPAPSLGLCGGAGQLNRQADWEFQQAMSSCTFCNIVAGKAPASVVYRDNRCMAFMDIMPVTSGHVLIIPLEHVESLEELDSTVGAHLFEVAQQLAGAIRRSGLKAEGINFYLADGEAAGQEVFHVHLHVFPRFEGDGFGLRFGPEYGQPVARERLERDASAISKAAATA